MENNWSEKCRPAVDAEESEENNITGAEGLLKKLAPGIVV